MKINKSIVLVLLLTSFLALTATSQISQVNSAISVEEVKACTTLFYDELQNVYGNCTFSYNYTSCLNSSGPNTNCSIQQWESAYGCKTGEINVTKNKTECQPPSKFIVSATKDTVTNKKEVDFLDWGVCVNSTENGCLAITCGTLKGGSARNGIFNGCDSGKSCQKFLFCQDSIKILQKASRDNFVEYDPTYRLPELAIKEVEQ